MVWRGCELCRTCVDLKALETKLSSIMKTQEPSVTTAGATSSETEKSMRTCSLCGM